MSSTRVKHILIIEDSPDLQDLLAQYFEDEGYKLTQAFNGKQGLEILRSMKELPSLILLDVMMPIMDGVAFRQEQKKEARFASIPVVVMTADSQPQARAEQMQVNEFVKKPLDMERLLAITAKLTA